MGRATAGVAAIRLGKGDEVVGMDVIHPDSNASLLVVTTKGLGKRTQLKDFPRQGRAGGGVRAITLVGKSGHIAVARVVSPDDDLVVISTNGQVIRMFTDGIPHKGRPAQGVAVMNMRENDTVASIARIPRTDKTGKMIGDEELEVLSEEEVHASVNGNGSLKATAAPPKPTPAASRTSSAAPKAAPATPTTAAVRKAPAKATPAQSAPAKAATRPAAPRATEKSNGKVSAPPAPTTTPTTTPVTRSRAKR